jgi:signal transduction histidine kinase
MNFRGRGAKLNLIIVAALLLLLPLLAILQYRWLAELSERQRGYLRGSMRSAAFRFSQDLDEELTRAYALFSFTPAPVKGDWLPGYAARYDRWLSGAQYPKLISAVLVARPAQGQLQLQQLQTETKQFAPCDWPAELTALRPQLEQALNNRQSPFLATLREHPVQLLTAERAAFVMLILLPPQRNQLGQMALLPPAGFMIVTLSLPVIQQEILPALAARHLHSADNVSAAIVTRTPERQLIYQFGPEAPAQGEADVTVNLMGLRREAFRRVLESFPPGEAPRGRPINDEAKLWQLRLTHAAGSLDAAVAALRRRNLLIDFGILALLAASVVLLILSARRSQQLAQQQMDFVAGVSHELRTPLAVIKSAAWSLGRGVVKEPEQLKKYSTLIGKESDRLIEMIEQILEFASAQSHNQKYELLPVGLGALIDNTLAAAQPLLTEGAFQVEKNIAPALPEVLAEPAALTRALRNLLDNAMKYGGEARWIGVSAQLHGQGRKAEIQITVSDHGLGIPAAELKNIFEPFWRGSEATAAQIRGNGLGLNLVRSIMQAHGGQISVQSTPGQGSAFTLHLPLASRKSEVGSRKSEVGSRKSEVRKSEVQSPLSADAATDY